MALGWGPTVYLKPNPFNFYLKYSCPKGAKFGKNSLKLACFADVGPCFPSINLTTKLATFKGKSRWIFIKIDSIIFATDKIKRADKQQTEKEHKNWRH